MQLQRQVHPDKFVAGSDQEKRLSMQQTSWINEAQLTLKDPVLRASYLLQLQGQDKDQGSETTMDAAFLMQQLELRERLDNIKNEADPLATLDAMAQQIKNSMNSMMADFSAAYEENRFEDARECIRKLQFLKKATQQIHALSADVEDELMS